MVRQSNLRYHNYHKHTHKSNIFTPDCIAKPIDYIKRIIELGYDIYFTTEHGWQGDIFEAYTLCQEYGLKCVYGTEAYYVDNMHDKTDRTNYHLVLIAMNETGRFEINKILSKANCEGFYGKARIDLNCLLSLTPQNVVVTTACIAGRLFTNDFEEKFLIPIMNHFGDNFFLETQSHNDIKQIEWNKKILLLKQKYSLNIIHGCDSHYIYPKDSKYRDLYIKAKGIFYPEEDGFTLDYPTYKDIVLRYQEQGVLSNKQIFEALNNTLVFDNATGITLDKEFKIPSIVGSLDKDIMLRRIVYSKWEIEKSKIDPKQHSKYENEIEYELDIVKKCGMADYFILDSTIVNRAVKEYDAILTKSGRGSAVSFYINKLLGLTEVDRISAPITLYPTRFMSAERILSSRSLPDIDLNFASTEPVVKASKDILGEDNVYIMIAYGTLQESGAFRKYCKGKGLHISEYEEVAKNLDNFKYNDYWEPLIEESKVFVDVIDSISPSPCSYLLLDKSISEEIGLLSLPETIDGKKTGNRILTCCLDGYNCDVYKYLKNDYLTVKVYEIISETYKLLGKKIDDIPTLITNCDEKVWEIYSEGLTETINQCSSPSAKQQLKKYKPRNLSELSAWVAAIRPGFKSMVDNFLNRLPYSTGVEELDKLLDDSFHYMIYQESIMKYLVWLDIEEKETYDIIKKISKKKFTDKELNSLENKLQKNWVKKLGSEENFFETWQVVNDAADYSFNASHSLSVAIDSLYGAYLKSHYPLEYFIVALEVNTSKSKASSELTKELDRFNIKLKPVQFGKSRDVYTMDKDDNSIYKGVASIGYCNKVIAEQLYQLSQQYKYDDFLSLLKDIKEKTSLKINQLKVLIRLDYFRQFGKTKYLLQIVNLFELFKYGDIKQIKKDQLDKYGITEYQAKIYSEKETEKLYKGINTISLLKELISKIKNEDLPVIDKIVAESEYLGYVDYTNDKFNSNYYIILNFEVGKWGTPYFVVRNLKTGEEIKTRLKNKRMLDQKPFENYSILEIDELVEDFRRVKLSENKWGKSTEKETLVDKYIVIANYSK